MIDLNTAGVRGGASWTPSNTALIGDTYTGVRGIWVGTAGNLALDFGAGSVVFTNVPVGLFPCPGVKKILSTGTAASGLVVVW